MENPASGQESKQPSATPRGVVTVTSKFGKVIAGSVTADFGPTWDRLDKSAKIGESTLCTMLINFGRVATKSDQWGLVT